MRHLFVLPTLLILAACSSDPDAIDDDGPQAAQSELAEFPESETEKESARQRAGEQFALTQRPRPGDFLHWHLPEATRNAQALDELSPLLWPRDGYIETELHIRSTLYDEPLSLELVSGEDDWTTPPARFPTSHQSVLSRIEVPDTQVLKDTRFRLYLLPGQAKLKVTATLDGRVLERIKLTIPNASDEVEIVLGE